MGIRSFTKKEQRQLRDKFLRENGHALRGIGDLGSSESEEDAHDIGQVDFLPQNAERYEWKTRVKRQIELMKNPDLIMPLSQS